MTLYFTEDHEWLKLEGDIATVGISDYAQEQLGDVVFVELPESGRQVAQGEDVAVVESVKAASDVYAPLAGDITATNEALESEPALVNQSAMDKGWFFKMKLADPEAVKELMDEAAYKQHIGQG